MRNICVFTGTRADYGLLLPLLREIKNDENLSLDILVSGMHLEDKFGATWTAIEKDGFKITAKVDMSLSDDSDVGIVKSMGAGLVGYADALKDIVPDMLVILGDRFEALAVAQAATVLRIPIAHIHGGEVTEGAYDDAFRHAITKMSYLHFASTPQYARRIIQMGEQPERVFHVGAIGLDHIKNAEIPDVSIIKDKFDFEITKPFFVVTHHPVTAADEDAQQTLYNILHVLAEYPEHQLVITYPNADNGGQALIDILETQDFNPEHVLLTPSLGTPHYLTTLKYADAVIGNSSSGIIEAPEFKTPTINIGLRQKGRIAADSVLHCDTDEASIRTALQTALSDNFQERLKHGINPYSKNVASVDIKNTLKTATLLTTKSFYDMETS